MPTCAFLSMDSLANFVSYDHLAMDALRGLGWQVEEVSWRNELVEWNAYNLVIIRTTWDYQQDPEHFLSVLSKIEESDAHLENDLELIRWNLNKSYLRELEVGGAEIVPTIWEPGFSEANFYDWFDWLATAEIIVKPLVSANADFTYRLAIDTPKTKVKNLAGVFANKPFLVQPFMPKIVSEGEFSVFFFGQDYSHTILKTPATGDFRVQEEHGGHIQSVRPSNHLLATAQQVFELIKPTPLYSRIDLVQTEKNSFALMEVELIEPSLYFSYSSQSAQLFANAVEQRVAARAQ